MEVGLGGETTKTLSSSLVTSLSVEWGLGESRAMSASIQGSFRGGKFCSVSASVMSVYIRPGRLVLLHVSVGMSVGRGCSLFLTFSNRISFFTLCSTALRVRGDWVQQWYQW